MARSMVPICGVATAAILAQSAVAKAEDCFIDSVNGNDANTGKAEDQAVKTQAKIPSTCTVAKFKRGSLFNEAVKVSSKVTTYTNYGSCSDPLPKFKKQRSPNNGSMFSSYSGGITIDGLYLAGSMSDAAMTNLMNGVCVNLGANSKLLNSEITDCDIGIMLSGEGSIVKGNYIHDLYISVDAAPGVDPNAVGGAEGIFVNASNCEVAYNSFVRCTSKAEWTGGSCDGGATEVTVGAGKTMSGVKIHHNFAYKTCGFFEMSSMAGSSKGTFADSEFYNNVMIDSGWMMLLQVNNTNTSNIRWDNNTVVHHKGEAINPGMIVTVFTGTSSGVSGGSLAKDTVTLTNNLIIMDGFGAQDFINALDANLGLVNSPVIKSPGTNPGVVNVAGTTAADFELVAGSSAIDKGANSGRSVDFANRTAPSGAAMDIGAFEYGASLAAGYMSPIPPHEAVNGCVASGGTPSTGGATGAGGATTGGGTSTKATGGAATGGSTAKATGGAQTGIGGTTSTGGANNATSSTSNATGGAQPQGDGGTQATANGGAIQATGTESKPPQGAGGETSGGSGVGSPSGGSGVGSPSSGGGTEPVATTHTNAAVEDGACSCSVVGNNARSRTGLLGLLGIGLFMRRQRRRGCTT